MVKHFPLNSHKFSEEAARAALAANAQGKFWEFHARLLENYNVMDEKKIQEIGRDLGLDMEKLNQDMNSPEFKRFISNDIRNGQRIGVRGTPSVFINGKYLKNRSLQGFFEFIDRELQKGER